MQVANGRNGITLVVSFTPSLALYLWQNLGKGLRQAVQHEDDVRHVWMWAAQGCCTKGYIAASMANISFLSTLLTVDPLQTLPVDRPLYFTADSPSDWLVLPPADPPVQVLLLFAQLLAVLAVDRSSILANIARTDDTTEAEESLSYAVGSKLEQLIDMNCNVPVQLKDPTRNDVPGNPQTLPQPSTRIVLLRTLILFLKLATLTLNVKADMLHGQIGSEMHHAVAALWLAIFVTALDFLTEIVDTKPGGTHTFTDDVNQEEQTLSTLLCERAAATLRQALKEPRAEKPRRACLQLLTAVLASMKPELMRQETKRLGTS